MPEKKPDTAHIVKSIFEREKKTQRVSSLFAPRKNTDLRHQQTLDAVKKEPPEKMLPIGIDIGSHSIKIARLTVIDNAPVIRDLALKEFPVEAMNDPNERKRKTPLMLRELIAEYNLKGDAYCALSANVTQIKHVSFPKMPQDEIDGAVRWEIQQTEGGSLDRLSFDYLILGDEVARAPERVEALIVSSDKDEILRQVALLESVGLQVRAVEVDMFSVLASMAYDNSVGAGEVAILLDFGGESTRLGIIVNKELQFVRVLNIGGSYLTNAIKDYCSVSYGEAENLKKRCGLCALPFDDVHKVCANITSDESSRVHNAIALSIEKLATDIEHTFKYFSYQLSRSKITGFDKVVLAGGSSGIKKFTTFLGNRLNVPIEVHNPFGIFEIHPDLLARIGDLQKEASRFSVAIGLALRAVEQ